MKWPQRLPSLPIAWRAARYARGRRAGHLRRWLIVVALVLFVASLAAILGSEPDELTDGHWRPDLSTQPGPSTWAQIDQRGRR